MFSYFKERDTYKIGHTTGSWDNDGRPIKGDGIMLEVCAFTITSNDPCVESQNQNDVSVSRTLKSLVPPKLTQSNNYETKNRDKKVIKRHVSR